MRGDRVEGLRQGRGGGRLGAAAIDRGRLALAGALWLAALTSAQEPAAAPPDLWARFDSKSTDVPALLQQLDEASRGQVHADYADGLIFALIANRIATLGPAEVDIAVRLRPAFDVACRWAGDPELAADDRETSSRQAAWLGTHIVDALMRRGAPTADALACAAQVPVWPGDWNGLWILVRRVDCLIALGRPDEAQRALEGIDVTPFEGDASDAAAMLVAACRADLDVHLGNHDEALRRLVPLRRDGTRLARGAKFDALAWLRFRKAYIGYLLAAERFAEVEDVVTEAPPAGCGPLPTAGTELLAMFSAVAALASSEADAADRQRARATLDRLGATAQSAETRCWADLHRTRDALRIEDADAAAAALQRAQSSPLAQTDVVRQLLETAEIELLLQRRENGASPTAQLRAASERLGTVWQTLQTEATRLPARPGGVGFLHYGFRRDLLAQRVALQLALDDSPRGVETAFELVLRADDALKGAEATPGPAATLQSLRQTLNGDEHGALVFVLGGASSHVFAADRGAVVCAPLAGTYALHAQMRALARELADALADFDGAAERPDLDARRRASIDRIETRAREMADALLPRPIREAMADWKQLSIVGSELLPQLPFECLRLDDALLGERFALDHWPSVGFAARRRAARAPEGDLRLALFGKVRRDGDEHGLGAAFVAPWHEGYRDPVVWLEQQCTLQRLRGLGETDVLVLVAHGERRRDLVRPLVLRLEDGVLTCDDVAGLARARFVVLAACNAAFGPNRFGAPLRADLAGAFLDRGAAAVAASPFALRLEPTVHVLEAALPLLSAGVPPAEALRRARCALAKDPKSAQAMLDRWTTAPLAVYGYGQRALR